MELSSLPYVKNFMIRMIESLPIGPNQFRLVLAQCSDDLSTEFMLDIYRRKGPMITDDIIQVNISDLINIPDYNDIAVQEDTTDIVLLLPGQQDTENYTFPYVKDFISKLIYDLPLESNQYHLALVQYNDDVHEEFELDT
ncbi:hypothetical protein QYF61_015704 [Mycteria americana]|uniref:VWFA domain-containing protein n=1 Tax=Mycteria americana TaxID=33587 RepID=A0AAN7P5X1_MYCAM|nr:hypothetical protein QYF61_015704 [Mycteria americana]